MAPNLTPRAGEIEGLPQVTLRYRRICHTDKAYSKIAAAGAMMKVAAEAFTLDVARDTRAEKDGTVTSGSWLQY